MNFKTSFAGWGTPTGRGRTRAGIWAALLCCFNVWTALAANPPPPSTAFTRDLLRSTNAPEARAKLGLSGFSTNITENLITTTNNTGMTNLIRAIAGTNSSSSSNLVVGKTVFVDSVNGTDATAIRGNAAFPALTFTGAVAKALSGDLIKFGPGVFRTLDDTFTITNQRLAIVGEGPNKTILTGVGSVSTDSAFRLTNGIFYVANLTISNEVHNTDTYRLPVYISGGPVEAIFENVRVDGESDGIYVSATNTSITLDGCYVRTTYDDVVFSCSGSSDLNVFNTVLIATNSGLFASSGLGQVRNLQFLSPGTANIVGNTMLLQDGLTTNSMNLLIWSNGIVNIAGNVMSSGTNKTIVSRNNATVTLYGQAVDSTSITGPYLVKGGVSQTNITSNLFATNVFIYTNGSLNLSNLAGSSILRTKADQSVGTVTIGTGLDWDGTTLNATNNVQVFAGTNLGFLTFETNAGAVSFIDLPINTNVIGAAVGTVMSYTMSIAGTNMLTFYATSSGINTGATNQEVKANSLFSVLKGAAVYTNDLSLWPTVPPARGAALVVSSNGYPYMLLSTNAGIGSTTWTGTNKLGW